MGYVQIFGTIWPLFDSDSTYVVGFAAGYRIWLDTDETLAQLTILNYIYF